MRSAIGHRQLGQATDLTPVLGGGGEAKGGALAPALRDASRSPGATEVPAGFGVQARQCRFSTSPCRFIHETIHHPHFLPSRGDRLDDFFTNRAVLPAEKDVGGGAK